MKAVKAKYIPSEEDLLMAKPTILKIVELQRRYIRFFKPDNKDLMSKLTPLIKELVQMKDRHHRYVFSYRYIAHNILDWDIHSLVKRVIDKSDFKRSIKQYPKDITFAKKPDVDSIVTIEDRKLLVSILYNLINNELLQPMTPNGHNKKNKNSDIEFILANSNTRLHMYPDENKIICTSGRPKVTSKSIKRSIVIIERNLNELNTRLDFESVLEFIMKVISKCNSISRDTSKTKIDLRKYYYILKER